MTTAEPERGPERSSARPAARSWWAWAARIGVALVALAALGQVLFRSDWSGASSLLSHAGPRAFLVLLSFPTAMALDACAQKLLFRELGKRPSFRPIFASRIAVEAVTMSLPGGTVFAETVNPLLLRRRCGIAYGTSLVVGAVKRWLIIRSEAVYIVLSVVLGYSVLSRASQPLLGRAGLPFLVLAGAAIPLVTSIVLSVAFFGGLVSQRTARVLESIPNRRLRAFIESKRSGFAESDEGFVCLWRARKSLRISSVLLFVGWLLESLDAMIILRVLGAKIGYADVIAFEAGLGLIRSIAFFVPAGLGVQDIGYIAFFSAVGLPSASAVGAAFIVLKRAKEAFFIVLGYLLFFWLRRMPKPAALAAEGAG